MKLITVDNYEELSKVAARELASTIKEKPNAILGLATGGSPVGMYKELIKMYQDGELDFSKIKTVNLDEYVGLNPEHEQSYRHFMNENLFNHVNININNTIVPNGLAQDLNAECKGKCSHTGGKKYCEDCGELKEDCTCNLQEEYCDVCGNRLEDCTCSESSSSEKSGYCEYCGNPNSVCGGECSHSGGKRYCSGCGNIKEKCTCEKEGEDLKEESSSSESSSVDDASAIDEKEPSKSEDLVSVASSQNSESSLAVDDANSQKTEKRTGE